MTSKVEIIKHFEKNTKTMCFLGVLKTEEGLKIEKELLDWLVNSYDVISIRQEAPGNQFEYPALSYMQDYCIENNIEYCLYLHTKGAANVKPMQKYIRNLWKHEFSDRKSVYETQVNTTKSVVICPFTGKAKTTWFNGFFINLRALKRMNKISLVGNRYHYETLFRTEPTVSVIGMIYNDVDDERNGNPYSRAKIRTFNYIRELYYNKDAEPSRMREDFMLENIDYSKYAKDLVKKAEGQKLKINLFNPVTIQDKINWLKLYDVNELKTKCADKIKLHEYCKEKLGKDLCIPIIKIYDHVNDIKWSELTDSFVLKCNHGSGMNIIVRNKANVNEVQAKQKIKNWLNTDFAFQNGYEMQYHNIERHAYAEEYMHDETQERSLYDYKFWCFNGHPKLWTINDGHGHGDIMYYDINGKPEDLYGVGVKNVKYEKPANFDLMVEYAKKLSEDFVFVRVDFYLINNQVYLGELTFTPGSGWFKYKNNDDNIRVGQMLDLKLPKNDKVIYTCITNNYDKLIPPRVYFKGYDFICFCDEEMLDPYWTVKLIPEKIRQYSSVKQQRYIKTHPHEFFKDYEYSIWVDANVEVLADPTELIKTIKSAVAIPQHPIRRCIYGEGKECIKLQKDTAENINKQLDRYREEKFPKNFGLVQSNIVIRKHNDSGCIKLMEDWWAEIEKGSHRDQLSFNYALWKNPDVTFEFLDKALYKSKWFNWRVKHGLGIKKSSATTYIEKPIKTIIANTPTTNLPKVEAASTWSPMTPSIKNIKQKDDTLEKLTTTIVKTPNNTKKQPSIPQKPILISRIFY